MTESQYCPTCPGLMAMEQKQDKLLAEARSAAIGYYSAIGYTGNIIIHKRVNESYGYRKSSEPRGNRQDIETIFINS